jgi:integrase
MRDLPSGVYRTRTGYRAIVAIAAGRKEKRFPQGTSLREITRWRNAMKVKLETKYPHKKAGALHRGTFAADVKRYLSTLAIASWASRRSELRAWCKRFGPISRSRVTTEHVQKAIKAWTDDGVPPKTVQNRLRALTAMIHALDGPEAWTPADHVSRPKVAKRRPRRVPVETLRAVEQQLRSGDPQTHARYMVLTATGARPVHLKRAVPADVDLARRYWNIPAAKDGQPIELWLNTDMVAAWRVFLDADAWGDFNATDYAKAVRAAGWPADIPPYNTKHSFGQAVAELGFSREDIADWYGHTNPETTKIYSGSANLRRLSEAIDGRLGWGQKLDKPLAVDLGRLSLDERKALLRKLLDETLSA